MDVRNPQWAFESGEFINVEVNHPVYGWIPFTASPNDVDQTGRDIYAACLAGDYGVIAPYQV